MKIKLGLWFLSFFLSITLCAATASASSYYLWDTWGGTWHDADKTASNTEDDLMCWAAAASNILDWTGWGYVTTESFSNQDSMFTYFQDHWTDEGGLMSLGWYWWFYGVNLKQGEAGWSQVDVAGGGFWTSYLLSSYYQQQTDSTLSLAAIAAYLAAGDGTTIGIYKTIQGVTYGHALTVWGYEYEYIDGILMYTGLWVTDSDDGQEALVYRAVNYINGYWYLTGTSWYIGIVQALALNDTENSTNTVPEPMTIILLGIGLAAVSGFRFNKR